MEYGFHLCGRKYTFLVFSPNQLKDHSAWFFAEDDNLKVIDVRRWMGEFSDRNVAKHAARMGLYFSLTYATIEVPSKEVNSKIPDIKRNNYTFSDGIGTITPDLAMEVAEKLQLTANAPSAYQIRFAGCEGLLSASNVPDDVFSRMQDSMVCKLDQMLENIDAAFEILSFSCSEERNTVAMIVGAGFKPQTEPYLRSMLSSIRVTQLRGLQEKTKIFVRSGRWLMGCLDELGVLEYGQCFIQVSIPSLENCFSKHGPEFSESMKNLDVIKGTVVIAKNPCLHPGDIRILEPVDVPGLRHLVDCLVFPQKADRPHTDEASGSDLDGDLYFVTWDGELIPPSKRGWSPMEYTPGEAKKLRRPVNNLDIIEFFTESMLSENLGTICNAHVVHADLSESGALDMKCIKLAKLAAIAVDFPKTGKLVSVPCLHLSNPNDIQISLGCQCFNHTSQRRYLVSFIEKVKDPCDGEIPSSRELCAPQDIPNDIDLEVPGSEDFTVDAWNRKCAYDRQLQALLGQYKVSNEAELVTGHIWSLYAYNSWKQGQVKEKLIRAYHALNKEFKRAFENLGPDFEQSSEEDENSVYEPKASAWYQVTYTILNG